MKCGCIPTGMIIKPEDVRDLYIDFCPLHASAGEMLLQLKRMYVLVGFRYEDKTVEALIARAEGKGTP